MAVKGIPVSVVETGFGTPVIPVEGNAPLMTVVDTGYGTPISIVETGYGTPFVVQGWPPIPDAPTNTAVPTISGTAQVGETLTSTNGTWTGYPTPTYTRAWQRSADGSAGWADIAGSTAITYVLVEADESQYIRMVVTGTNSEGSSTANSNSVGPVAAPPVESPFAAFTVEAGTGNDGDTGYYSTIYGGVSAEPLAGFPLLEFSTRNANYTQVAFTGDCLTTVSGWVPVIDGVTIGAAISDWAFDGEYTSGTWESTGAMVETQQYAITWEQPA